MSEHKGRSVFQLLCKALLKLLEFANSKGGKCPQKCTASVSNPGVRMQSPGLPSTRGPGLLPGWISCHENRATTRSLGKGRERGNINYFKKRNGRH